VCYQEACYCCIQLLPQAHTLSVGTAAAAAATAATATATAGARMMAISSSASVAIPVRTTALCAVSPCICRDVAHVEYLSAWCLGGYLKVGSDIVHINSFSDRVSATSVCLSELGHDLSILLCDTSTN
jgi:type IV secretory pathway TrbL component